MLSFPTVVFYSWPTEELFHLVATHGARWGRELVIGLASEHVSGFAYELTTEYASELAEG